MEVALPERRSISSFIETNGTLEAENDIDIVARTTGPVVELLVEEGMVVEKGQLLARIDDKELQAQVGVARVALEEARRTHQRAMASFEESVISQEVYDQTITKLESAKVQLEGNQILLGYSKIEAPFAGNHHREVHQVCGERHAESKPFPDLGLRSYPVPNSSSREGALEPENLPNRLHHRGGLVGRAVFRHGCFASAR